MPGTPPTPDIFDDPSISLCINSEWASFIDAQVGRLLSRSLWEGTDAEIDRAIDQVQQFLTKLGDIGVCALTPVGGIMMYGDAAPPIGWLPCDGRAVGRADYPDLFAVIGTNWGPGDGVTTFNVPDMTDRLPMGFGGAVVGVGATAGALTHTLTSGEIPAHSHGVTDPGHVHQQHIGNNQNMLAFVTGGAGTFTPAGAATSSAAAMNTANNTTGISTNNAGGGGSHSILNPVVGVPFIIFSGV